MLAVGVAVGFLLAFERLAFFGPHESAVNLDIGTAGVVARLATKAKELRAGGPVARSHDGIIASNVEDELVVPHKRVVDIQRLLVFVAIRVERAIIHVNGDVLRAGFSVDVDDLTGCVKGAGVKRHDRRAVGPQE